MTKKHFVALADVVRNHNKSVAAGWIETLPFTQIQIQTLADFCKSQNSQFNRERWLGYIAGTNGPNGGVK